MSFAELFSLALGAILMENFVLVKFLGCCPFLGVSKKTETAVGMGMAVIFVMTVASAATGVPGLSTRCQFTNTKPLIMVAWAFCRLS